MATPVPVEDSPRYRLLQSAEVLGAAAKSTGLLDHWHLDEAQAGTRLGELLSLNPVPNSVLLEVKLQPIPGADAVSVCQVILDRVFAEEAATSIRKAEEKMAAVQTRVEEAKAELTRAEESYATWSGKADREASGFSLGEALAKSEYRAKEFELEDWMKVAETMRKELEAAREVEGSHARAEWRRSSVLERLRSSGPVIVGSLAAGAVLGFVLAALLERMQRPVAKEACTNVSVSPGSAEAPATQSGSWLR